MKIVVCPVNIGIGVVGVENRILKGAFAQIGNSHTPNRPLQCLVDVMQIGLSTDSVAQASNQHTQRKAIHGSESEK